MRNSSAQQNKVLLLACFLSLAVHMSIIIIVSKTLSGKTTIPTKKIIEIELVEIRTKQQPILAVLKPNNQRTINTKKPPPMRQLKPLLNQQATSQKPKGGSIKKENSAAAAASRTNQSGDKSVNKTTSPTSSKEKISIIQKEKPRCRPQCRKPLIPRRAEKRGEEGYAIFRLYVDQSGQVFKTELLESSGHSGWNNSARKTAMSQNFHPMVQRNTIEIMYEMKTQKK